MNAVVEQQDAERMSARIEALEFLVRQQKDFIEESATIWRGLLEREQALGAQGWNERNKLDERFHALSDLIRSAETETAELKAQLLKAEHGRQESDQAREQAQDRLKQLTDQLSKLDNMLRQRQEEIEQAWSALAEHRARVAELEASLDAAAEREAALEQKLKEADSWVFKLAGERTEREKQLEILIRERNSTTEKLMHAHRQLSSLRKRLDQLTAEPAKPAQTKDIDGSSDTPVQNVEDEKDFQPRPAESERDEDAARVEKEVHRTVTAIPSRVVRSPGAFPLSHSSEAKAEDAIPAIEVLMKPVIERDKKLFLEKLTVTNNASPPLVPSVTAIPIAKPKADIATEQPSPKLEARLPSSQVPMRMTVPARNPQLERQVKAAETDIRWLRELSLACLDMPKRWSFMPLSWHLSRIKERFSQKDLFDKQAYLSKYPDVAESSIDPLIHYLKHGMDEGRER